MQRITEREYLIKQALVICLLRMTECNFRLSQSDSFAYVTVTLSQNLAPLANVIFTNLSGSDAHLGTISTIVTPTLTSKRFSLPRSLLRSSRNESRICFSWKCELEIFLISTRITIFLYRSSVDFASSWICEAQILLRQSYSSLEKSYWECGFCANNLFHQSIVARPIE